MTDALPGLDLARLTSWFSIAVPEAGTPLQAELIAGGKSNLTYAVTDGVGRWVLRRPPLGHVLATAHDMGREYRVMAALEPTAVPVPRTVAFCDDADVVGAPCYVMEWVAGTPYRHAAELTALGPARSRMISERLVDTLASLGAIDPDQIGLGDFGRPGRFRRRRGPGRTRSGAARCGLGRWWPWQHDNAKRRHSFHDPFHGSECQRSNYAV